MDGASAGQRLQFLCGGLEADVRNRVGEVAPGRGELLHLVFALLGSLTKAVEGHRIHAVDCRYSRSRSYTPNGPFALVSCRRPRVVRRRSGRRRVDSTRPVGSAPRDTFWSRRTRNRPARSLRLGVRRKVDSRKVGIGGRQRALNSESRTGTSTHLRLGFFVPRESD